MRREAPRDISYTRRHGHMAAAHSIRDFWDLVLELITNSDDGYHGQFVDGHISEDGGPILIEVEPHRSPQSSIVRIKDRAGGFHDLAEKISEVGERTSRPGDRGFMARGLKDCAALGHITIETVIDGRLDKAEITPSFQFISYKSSRKGGETATKADRERLGLRRGNGTVVEVVLEPRVRIPLLETLRRDLPWHYALRDIAGVDRPSKLLLRHSKSQDTEPLICVEPEGEVVYDREHEVPGYENFRFRFTLNRATEPLEDPTDLRFRRSGLLIKGQRGIHGCSFLASELERDPAADLYYGRIECPGIDLLAEEWDTRRAEGQPHTELNPVFILDPNRRGGLAEDHPFVRALFQEPAEILKQQLEEERNKREKRRKDVEATETTARLKQLAREASRFMRDKLEDLGAGSPGDVVDHKTFHSAGIGVSPVFTQIRVGESKRFTVKANAEGLNLPPGTPLGVGLGKNAEGAVEIAGATVPMEVDPLDPRLLRGAFTLIGRAESPRLKVACIVDGLDAVFAEVQVVSGEPVDIEIPNGLAFHRKNYTVRAGGRRKLVVQARFTSPVAGSPKSRFEDNSVAVIREQGAFRLVPGTTYYEASLVVEGRKPNGRTAVIVEVDERSARCGLRVGEKDDEGVDLTFKLVDHDLGANYRAAWDRKEPNKLLITTKHESIARYLGSSDAGYPGQQSEPFRVLIAELISDNVCRRIVEAHAQSQPDALDSDAIYRLHNGLMKEFTPIAHRTQLASPS